MLYIEPMAGLCNRMRAIDSAAAMSKVLNIPLKIIWIKNNELNCPFNKLFEPIEDIPVIEKTQHPLLPVRLAMYQHFSAKHFDQKKIKDMMQNEKDFRSLKHYSSVYIRTFESFYPSENPFAIFKPSRELLQCIETYDFSECIGIHIRRADHLKSIKHSPTSDFIELMKAEILKDASIRFFLSTDSKTEETLLSAEFGDRIIMHPKHSTDRSLPSSYKDAVIDLYCLSKCKKIIGSHGSSFSRTAAQIRGIELVTVFKEEQE